LFGLSTYKSEAADKKLSSVIYCTVFVYLCIYEYHEIYLKDFQEKMIVSLFHSSFVKKLGVTIKGNKQSGGVRQKHVDIGGQKRRP
jgi:hypothetical protein